MKSWVLAIAAAAASLGFVSNAVAQSHQYVVTVKPAGAASGFQKLKVDKAAVGDTEIILWQNLAIQPDCNEVPGVSLKVLQQPEHGQVRLVDEGVFPNFPPANARSRCNDRKVPGHTAYYKANAGYAGRDKVVIQGSSPGGTVREVTLEIEVRPAA